MAIHVGQLKFSSKDFCKKTREFIRSAFSPIATNNFKWTFKNTLPFLWKLFDEIHGFLFLMITELLNRVKLSYENNKYFYLDYEDSLL